MNSNRYIGPRKKILLNENTSTLFTRRPILYSKLRYKFGQDIFDIQYNICGDYGKVSLVCPTYPHFFYIIQGLTS